MRELKDDKDLLRVFLGNMPDIVSLSCPSPLSSIRQCLSDLLTRSLRPALHFTVTPPPPTTTDTTPSQLPRSFFCRTWPLEQKTTTSPVDA